MSVIAMPEKIVRIIDRLETAGEIEAKLGQVVANELRRRLARYELTDRLFRRKYGLTFEEFEKNEMVKKLGYSFEVESDYHDWDMAIDGIETLRRDLEELRSS
jgi:stress response protein SCP2